jgi:hypothetical protein
MEKTTKQTIIFRISLIGIIILYTFIYNNFYLGDYIIQKQWIDSNYNNKTYCENCLWIEFSEGCNRYPVYFFENQHEFDKRLSLGSVVNIRFNGNYVRSVDLAHKYRAKCFSEFDYTFYLILFLIVILIFIIFIFILYKTNGGKFFSSQT